jgi:hypothetical protein
VREQAEPTAVAVPEDLEEPSFQAFFSEHYHDDVVWIANHDDSSLTRVRLVCCGEIQPSPAPTPRPEPTPSPLPTATREVTRPAPGPSPTLPHVGRPVPPVPFQVGRHLVGPGIDAATLAEPDGREAGDLSPVASILPDGRIVYLAWADDVQGTEIHVFDPRVRRDDVRVVGASSVAVRSDGLIAYALGSTDLHLQGGSGSPGPGGIEVDSSPAFDASTSWVQDGANDIVVGWAGSSLLAYRLRGGGVLEVLALDGPGQVRTLAQGAVIVAISPDGSKVMLAGQTNGSSIPGTVEVVDVADGNVVAAAKIASLHDPDSPVPLSIVAIGYGEDWVGDRVVAPASGATVIMRVDGASIQLKRSIQTEEPGDALNEPQFVNGDPDRIIGWSAKHRPGVADLRYAWTECALSGADPSCVTGPAENEPIRPIRSLSRPVAPGN